MTKIVMMSGAPFIKFLFRDEFWDDRAAGAINGIYSTDGKALRTVTDTESKLTQSGGKSIFSGGKSSPADGDPGRWWPGDARSTGLSAFGKVTISDASKKCGFGFDTNQAGAIANGIELNNSVIYADSVNVGAFATGDYYIAEIIRSAGKHYLIKGGAFTNWTLLWVGYSGTDATIYPGIANYDSADTFDFTRLAQLPSPWTNDYGIATQRLAGERANWETFTHEADCLIEWTVTTMKNNVAARFRKQDENNFWYVQTNEDGRIFLIEYVAGSGTTRAVGAAGTITNGQRIVVIAEGTVIKVFVNNVLKFFYTSATNFATSTSGQINFPTGGAISDVVSWPRTLSTHLQNMLNRYVK